MSACRCISSFACSQRALLCNSHLACFSAADVSRVLQDITSGGRSSASASIERMFLVLRMPAANTTDDVEEHRKFLGRFKKTLGAAAARIQPSRQQQQSGAGLQMLKADVENVLQDQGLQVQRYTLGALMDGDGPLARQPARQYASSVAKLAADVRGNQPTAAAASTTSSLAAFQQLVSDTHTIVLQKKGLLACADLYQYGQQEALKHGLDSFIAQAAAVCDKAYQSVLDDLPKVRHPRHVMSYPVMPGQALPHADRCIWLLLSHLLAYKLC